jgi:flagellar protein FlgJ
MRQPDFSTAPARALAPSAATVSNVAASRTGAAPAGAGFGALFLQVQGEVADFIAQGGHQGAMPPASTLSVEGAAYRALAPAAAASGAGPQLQQQFLASIAPWAQEAAQRLGVSPHLVSAHAALESGWGQRPLRQGGGDTTNNLFGIKASSGWHGEVAPATTTEYEHGVALKKTERFRSYPDQASAFRDYAQLLLDNPRYRSALNVGADAGAFAQGLARGGYATDPSYADKLTRLAARLQAPPPPPHPSVGSLVAAGKSTARPCQRH